MRYLMKQLAAVSALLVAAGGVAFAGDGGHSCSGVFNHAKLEVSTETLKGAVEGIFEGAGIVPSLGLSTRPEASAGACDPSELDVQKLVGADSPGGCIKRQPLRAKGVPDLGEILDDTGEVSDGHSALSPLGCAKPPEPPIWLTMLLYYNEASGRFTYLM